jgi:F0F1-type ATP synthase delta subunit
MSIPWARVDREAAEAAMRKHSTELISEDRRRFEILWKKHQKVLDLLRNHSLKAIQAILSQKILGSINAAMIDELIESLSGVGPEHFKVDSSSKEIWLFVAGQLEPSQQEALMKVFSEKFGPDINVKECLDPDLVAGLRFKIGNLEIDGSLLNRCQEYDGQLTEGLDT